MLKQTGELEPIMREQTGFSDKDLDPSCGNKLADLKISCENKLSVLMRTWTHYAEQTRWSLTAVFIDWFILIWRESFCCLYHVSWVSFRGFPFDFWMYFHTLYKQIAS